MAIERPWLTLTVLRKAEPVIAAHGVSAVARSHRGFLRAYEDAGGKPAHLGRDTHSGQAWRARRNAFVARHIAQARAKGEPWWRDGEPTRRHLALLAWACTPTPQRLAAWLRSP